MIQLIGFFFFILLLIAIVWYFIKHKRKKNTQISVTQKELLQQHVVFYQQLMPTDKLLFENKIMQFLGEVSVTGVNTEVEELDEILIASGAVIPIFQFKDWHYQNLNEVLLYPDAFNEDYKQAGQDRSILGMVGMGAMHRTMILSKPSLHQGFADNDDGHNTAIHEFVHLIDKTDGEIDGTPDILIPHKYAVPWLHLMHEEIQCIRDNKSELNPYGTTNEAEFFAVAAEYFYEKPDTIKTKHPELFQYLEMIFLSKIPTKEN